MTLKNGHIIFSVNKKLNIIINLYSLWANLIVTKVGLHRIRISRDNWIHRPYQGLTANTDVIHIKQP